LSIVSSYFRENNIEFIRKDVRNVPERFANFEHSGAFEHRDYQAETIDLAVKKTRGIIMAATGAGKTVMASGIIKELRVLPVVFFVTSIDLLTQAKESFEKALLLDGQPLKVGQIGGGVVDIKSVNVMTVQTAVRALGKSWSDYRFDSDDKDDNTPIGKHRDEIKELLQECKLSFCDEVQHWRAKTCRDVASELHQAYYTFGMSATPYRDEGDDMLIQACFGKAFVSIPASKLIKQGWLIRPDIKMIHIRTKKSVYKTWMKLYKDQVVENKYYNEAVAKIATAYINRGRLVLVLVQQINHGKALAGMIPGAVFLSGASTKKKREAGIKNLRNKYISCIVSTTIFDEGIDIKPLDTVLLAGQGKSRTRAMQRIGRILRPFENKEKATAIDFYIHQKYLSDHAKERYKMYVTESEYVVEEIDPRLS
jgi:superfamily II DNA or RNA helicase